MTKYLFQERYRALASAERQRENQGPIAPTQCNRCCRYMSVVDKDRRLYTCAEALRHLALMLPQAHKVSNVILQFKLNVPTSFKILGHNLGKITGLRNIVVEFLMRSETHFLCTIVVSIHKAKTTDHSRYVSPDQIRLQICMWVKLSRRLRQKVMTSRGKSCT